MSELPLGWKKAEVAAKVLIPIVVAGATYLYSRAQREQEVSLRYIEIAMEVLHEPETSNTAHLRKWATSILKQYSPIDIPDAAVKEIPNLRPRLRDRLNGKEGDRNRRGQTKSPTSGTETGKRGNRPRRRGKSADNQTATGGDSPGTGGFASE